MKADWGGTALRVAPYGDTGTFALEGAGDVQARGAASALLCGQLSGARGAPPSVLRAPPCAVCGPHARAPPPARRPPQALLGDTIAQAQAMRASPHVEPIREEAAAWEALLAAAQARD